MVELQTSLQEQQQRDRDTFLYAAEIEGLDEEHPLRTPHFEHSYVQAKLPFHEHTVGAFSCHGVEPLPLRRYVTAGLKLDNVVDAHLIEHPPVVRKINQDRGAIAHPYANDRKTALFAAYDGHGLQGDDVAEFAMVQTLTRLKKHPGTY